MAASKVAVLIGSLRRESLNREDGARADRAGSRHVADGNRADRDLPLYNQDLEGQVPPAWAAFREQIRDVQAVLFVAPEYNRSVPAPLKNAIDVGSRPSGKSAWAGKPCAVVSVSPVAIGGFGANHHLRQSLMTLTVPALPREAYLGGADKLFDAAGQLSNA